MLRVQKSALEPTSLKQIADSTSHEQNLKSAEKLNCKAPVDAPHLPRPKLTRRLQTRGFGSGGRKGSGGTFCLRLSRARGKVSTKGPRRCRSPSGRQGSGTRLSDMLTPPKGPGVQAVLTGKLVWRLTNLQASTCSAKEAEAQVSVRLRHPRPQTQSRRISTVPVKGEMRTLNPDPKQNQPY